MGSMSIWHWLIVLLVVALVFGTKKLRNIGGDLGGAVKSFKEGMSSLNGALTEDHRHPASGTAASDQPAKPSMDRA